MKLISKYQAGGQAPQGGQNIELQVIALVQAAMQGDEQATQTIQQIMQAAEQGDPQATQIAQMIQQVMQSQQQAQPAMRKSGGHLNHIHSLNTGCPEGTEPNYYRIGGRVCKTCLAKKKGGEMTKCAKCGMPIKKCKCGGKPVKKHLIGGWMQYVPLAGVSPIPLIAARANSAAVDKRRR